MSEMLTDKVAAVTGAASGIGLECARHMLAAGASVVLIDRAGRYWVGSVDGHLYRFDPAGGGFTPVNCTVVMYWLTQNTMVS